MKESNVNWGMRWRSKRNESKKRGKSEKFGLRPTLRPIFEHVLKWGQILSGSLNKGHSYKFSKKKKVEQELFLKWGLNL